MLKIFLDVFATETKKNRLYKDILYVLLALITIIFLEKSNVETKLITKEI